MFSIGLYRCKTHFFDYIPEKRVSKLRKSGTYLFSNVHRIGNKNRSGWMYLDACCAVSYWLYETINKLFSIEINGTYQV